VVLRSLLAGDTGLTPGKLYRMTQKKGSTTGKGIKFARVKDNLTQEILAGGR
jgi:hypothetical protein